MVVGTLERFDFDTLENHPENALSSKVLGTFVASDGLTAHGKAARFISALPPLVPYLAYDGKVYPRLVYSERVAL